MSGYANRWEQAINGLDVAGADGIVRVRDGQDTWLCWRVEWDEARRAMQTLEPVLYQDFEDEEPRGDEGEAYTQLCQAISEGVSLNGGWQGDRERCIEMLERALVEGLIDEGEALAKELESARGAP